MIIGVLEVPRNHNVGVSLRWVVGKAAHVSLCTKSDMIVQEALLIAVALHVGNAAFIRRPI